MCLCAPEASAVPLKGFYLTSVHAWLCLCQKVNVASDVALSTSNPWCDAHPPLQRCLCHASDEQIKTRLHLKNMCSAFQTDTEDTGACRSLITLHIWMLSFVTCSVICGYFSRVLFGSLPLVVCVALSSQHKFCSLLCNNLFFWTYTSFPLQVLLCKLLC